jgi:hypothetical protein
MDWKNCQGECCPRRLPPQARRRPLRPHQHAAKLDERRDGELSSSFSLPPPFLLFFSSETRSATFTDVPSTLSTATSRLVALPAEKVGRRGFFAFFPSLISPLSACRRSHRHARFLPRRGLGPRRLDQVRWRRFHPLHIFLQLTCSLPRPSFRLLQDSRRFQRPLRLPSLCVLIRSSSFNAYLS